MLLLLICSSINILFANCSFQSRIFAELNENNIGKNVIISPLSIFQILSLTANGAKNSTLESMIEALGSKDVNSLNKINYDILDSSNSFTSIEIANAIMTKFTPESDFVEVSKNYLATIEPLLSVEQVNDWCSTKTHGKITEIIEELDPLLRMILLNAVYYKGNWIYKFDKFNTKENVFYNFNKEEKKVKMMNQIEHFRYYENEEIQIVELPCVEDMIFAFIILPNKNIDINEYINSFKTNEDFDLKLNDIFNKELKKLKVDLVLPKFKVTFSESLKKYLKSMGMSIAFGEKADFSGMTKEEQLFIDDVLHKTYLDVNEEGVEAAAITGVLAGGGAMPIKETIYSMEVNRPFLFLLRSLTLPGKNNLLFMAKIEEL